jgi:polar amino acid transport system substrate-binding protein
MPRNRHALIAFLAAMFFSPLATAAEPLIYTAGPIPGFSNPEPVDGRDGLNIDLMRAILDRLGDPYKIDLVPWKRAITMTNAGKAAAVFTCSYRKEREETLIYSDPLRDLTGRFKSQAHHI